MYVYVLEMEDRFKVGSTECLKDRIDCIQSYNPFKIHVLGIISTDKAKFIENAIHLELKSYHVHREWFNPPKKVILEILNRFAFDKNVKIETNFGVGFTRMKRQEVKDDHSSLPEIASWVGLLHYSKFKSNNYYDKFRVERDRLKTVITNWIKSKNKKNPNETYLKAKGICQNMVSIAKEGAKENSISDILKMQFSINSGDLKYQYGCDITLLDSIFKTK